MALIKCPECGRDNVSDTADSCPTCGYSLKEYHARENRKKLFAEQQRQFEERKEREWNKLQRELNAKLAEIDRLKPSDEPEKPTVLKHIFYYNNSLSLISWALILGVILLFLSFAAEFFIFLLAVLIVIGIPFAAFIVYADWGLMLSYYQNKYEEWKEQQTNWDQYIEKKKQLVINEYKSIASNMARSGTRTISMPKTNTPKEQLKCPVCGAIDIDKISTLDRSVSVALVGLASGKIGKQYKCKKCKHMW